MDRKIVAFAVIAIASLATGAQAQTSMQLSDVPPGAIHTPGIGPGYIYPSTPGGGPAPTTALMPTGMSSDSIPAMNRAQAVAHLRTEGYANVENLRQIDGTWYATIRGRKATAIVAPDGSVSVEQW